jgi:hypothetical protein
VGRIGITSNLVALSHGPALTPRLDEPPPAV